MELLDIYDASRRRTGNTHVRGIPAADGEHYIVVHIWFVNSKGEYLLARRQFCKQHFPGFWDCAAAGFVSSGEESRDAALREVREEIGVTLSPEELRLLFTVSSAHFFDDVYLVYSDIPASALTLQKEEVAQAKWASASELEALTAEGVFLRRDYHDDIFAAAKALISRLKLNP